MRNPIKAIYWKVLKGPGRPRAAPSGLVPLRPLPVPTVDDAANTAIARSGGAVLSNEFYGETCTSEAYVRPRCGPTGSMSVNSCTQLESGCGRT
jgi:hypothetical protein